MSSTDDASYVWPYLLPYVVLQPFQNLTKVQGILHHHWMLQPRSFILDSPLLIYIQSMMFGRTLFVFLVPLCPLWFLCAVFSNLPGAHGEPDSYKCTEYNNLSAFVGQDVVLLEKVPETGMLYIASANSHLFEFMDGNLRKSCSKCVCKNSSAVLKNIKLNESGMYTVNIINERTICRNLTVTGPPGTPAPSQTSTIDNSTTPGPKVPPSDPKESSDIKGSINTTALICCTLAAVAAVAVALFIYYYWQEIKSCFQNIFKGRTNCERSVRYMECNGRVNGETSSSNSSNPTVPGQQDEGSALLYSIIPADTAIAVPNGDTEHSNGTGTDPA